MVKFRLTDLLRNPVGVENFSVGYLRVKTNLAGKAGERRSGSILSTASGGTATAKLVHCVCSFGGAA